MSQEQSVTLERRQPQIEHVRLAVPADQRFSPHFPAHLNRLVIDGPREI